MSIQNLFHVGLFLHIVGLTTVAGVTLAGYITSRQFWIQYTQDKQKGFAVMQAIARLPVMAGAGLLLMILSGVMMLTAIGGHYGQQLWFRIKMIVVIIIITSSIFLKRRLERRLRRWVLDDMTHGDMTPQIGNLARKIAYVQLFLLSLFIIIFILSVFKFT